MIKTAQITIVPAYSTMYHVLSTYVHNKVQLMQLFWLP